VILGTEAHSYRYEAGGLAVLGSIHPQTITNRADGTLDLAEVEAAIKPDDPHFPRTRLIALENTITGRVLPREYMAKAAELAKRKNLAIHLDGARVFNAATHLGRKVKDLCAGFDSVSSCLSKGLGTPAGTVLLGSKSFIGKARRSRKILGGAMRQAGVIAAAGLYALEHNVERLADDHARARRAAEAMAEAAPAAVDVGAVETNIVIVDVAAAGWTSAAFVAGAIDAGVRTYAVGPGAVRLVWHLDVDDAATDLAIDVLTGLLRSAPSS
jgi:threonine aldolase